MFFSIPPYLTVTLFFTCVRKLRNEGLIVCICTCLHTPTFPTGFVFFARCNGLFSECGTISDRHPIFYTDLGRDFSDLQIFYLSLFNQAFCVKAKILGCKLSFYFYTVGAKVFTTVDRNPLFNKVLQRTKVSI
uniref:Uncharacterized protein n=1 Tax=Anguilla anguilla TaxID=7936 RepID=A0A0E9XB25_ANGAN